MITARCPSKVSRATRAEDPTVSNYSRVACNGSVREIPLQLQRRERGARCDERVAHAYMHPIKVAAQKRERQRVQTLNRVADILDWVVQTLDAPAAVAKPAQKRARKSAKAMKGPGKGLVATDRLLALQAHFNAN